MNIPQSRTGFGTRAFCRTCETPLANAPQRAGGEALANREASATSRRSDIAANHCSTCAPGRPELDTFQSAQDCLRRIVIRRSRASCERTAQKGGEQAAPAARSVGTTARRWRAAVGAARGACGGAGAARQRRGRQAAHGHASFLLHATRARLQHAPRRRGAASLGTAGHYIASRPRSPRAGHAPRHVLRPRRCGHRQRSNPPQRAVVAAQRRIATLWRIRWAVSSALLFRLLCLLFLFFSRADRLRLQRHTTARHAATTQVSRGPELAERYARQPRLGRLWLRAAPAAAQHVGAH